jgi:HEAT repeat protein
LKTKDDRVLYEVLVALQKIRDPEAAPKIAFLLKDFNEKVQIAAIETTGLLQNREALPSLRDVLERSESKKVKRAALTAVAMLPDASSHSLYERHFADKDDGLRAAAAEGYARLKNPADLDAVKKAFEEEKKTGPRLAQAFALVSLGQTDVSEFSPLQYLVNNLNSRSYKGVAEPYLNELARDPAVRNSLYPMLSTGMKEEKMGLGRVIARSGEQDAVPHLEKLSKDGDADVATEGLRALQNLRARLP